MNFLVLSFNFIRFLFTNTIMMYDYLYNKFNFSFINTKHYILQNEHIKFYKINVNKKNISFIENFSFNEYVFLLYYYDNKFYDVSDYLNFHISIFENECEKKEKVRIITDYIKIEIVPLIEQRSSKIKSIEYSTEKRIINNTLYGMNEFGDIKLLLQPEHRPSFMSVFN